MDWIVRPACGDGHDDLLFRMILRTVSTHKGFLSWQSDSPAELKRIWIVFLTCSKPEIMSAGKLALLLLGVWIALAMGREHHPQAFRIGWQSLEFCAKQLSRSKNEKSPPNFLGPCDLRDGFYCLADRGRLPTISRGFLVLLRSELLACSWGPCPASSRRSRWSPAYGDAGVRPWRSMGMKKKRQMKNLDNFTQCS
jgi:hypothetical protein